MVDDEGPRPGRAHRFDSVDLTGQRALVDMIPARRLGDSVPEPFAYRVGHAARVSWLPQCGGHRAAISERQLCAPRRRTAHRRSRASVHKLRVSSARIASCPTERRPSGVVGLSHVGAGAVGANAARTEAQAKAIAPMNHLSEVNTPKRTLSNDLPKHAGDQNVDGRQSCYEMKQSVIAQLGNQNCADNGGSSLSN